MSMLLEGDTPRARRHDPVSSHKAADLSALTRLQVRDAVLALVFEHPLSDGNTLNGLYQSGRVVNGWPVAHWDSPRKRLSELHADGLVERLENPDGRGGVYVLTVAGLHTLGKEQ